MQAANPFAEKPYGANSDPARMRADRGLLNAIDRNPAGDVELETRRLQLAIDGNVLTDYVIENGMGTVDPDRMATALEQLTLTYDFQTEPDMALYFTDAYLPDAEVRMVAPE